MWGSSMLPEADVRFELDQCTILEFRNPCYMSSSSTDTLIAAMRHFLGEMYADERYSCHQIKDLLFTEEYIFNTAFKTDVLLILHCNNKVLGFASGGLMSDGGLHSLYRYGLTVISEEVEGRLDIMKRLNVRLTIRGILAYWSYGHHTGKPIPIIARSQNPVVLMHFYRLLKDAYPYVGEQISQNNSIPPVWVRQRYAAFEKWSGTPVESGGIQRNVFNICMTPGGKKKVNRIPRNGALRNQVLLLCNQLGQHDYIILTGNIAVERIDDFLYRYAQGDEESVEDIKLIRYLQKMR
jgi:hypothetical protein